MPHLPIPQPGSMRCVLVAEDDDELRGLIVNALLANVHYLLNLPE